MSETTHRVLRLLGLLESRTSWTGPELADRLGVTERTVRRDVARLRELGYPVDAERGTVGGYRLGAGRRLPPLLLDDDEAVALVACLRMAALGGDDGVGEAALRALGKLDAVLPPQVRALAGAVDAATVALPTPRPEVDWSVLSALAAAQRDRHRVRFSYTATDGAVTERDVEPTRLLTQGQLWYLQAFDLGRDDWRTFRLDRVSALQVTTWTFQLRPPPPVRTHGDVASRWPCVARVRLGAAASEVARRVPSSHRDRLDEGGGATTFGTGGATWDELAFHLLWVARDLGTRLEVVDGDGLREALARLASTAARAANP